MNCISNSNSSMYCLWKIQLQNNVEHSMWVKWYDKYFVFHIEQFNVIFQPHFILSFWFPRIQCLNYWWWYKSHMNYPHSAHWIEIVLLMKTIQLKYFENLNVVYNFSKYLCIRLSFQNDKLVALSLQEQSNWFHQLLTVSDCIVSDCIIRDYIFSDCIGFSSHCIVRNGIFSECSEDDD